MNLLKIIALFFIINIGFMGTIYAANEIKTSDIINKKETVVEKKIEVVKHVDINTADIETLQNLKGIGVKRAKEIIDYRNKNGEFKKIEDLKSIKGFTDKFIIKLQKDNPGMLEIGSKKIV